MTSFTQQEGDGVHPRSHSHYHPTMGSHAPLIAQHEVCPPLHPRKPRPPARKGIPRPHPHPWGLVPGPAAHQGAHQAIPTDVTALGSPGSRTHGPSLASPPAPTPAQTPRSSLDPRAGSSPVTSPAEASCQFSYPPLAFIILREKLSTNEGELICHSHSLPAGAGHK